MALYCLEDVNLWMYVSAGRDRVTQACAIRV